MTITIKGLNSLTKKLNKLDNIKAKSSVNEVAKIVEKGLRDEASNFSRRAHLIGEVDTREYSNGTYCVDVGLKNDSQPWEDWKHLIYRCFMWRHILKNYFNSVELLTIVLRTIPSQALITLRKV